MGHVLLLQVRQYDLISCFGNMTKTSSSLACNTNNPSARKSTTFAGGVPDLCSVGVCGAGTWFVVPACDFPSVSG
jgi:hypothetical protein